MSSTWSTGHGKFLKKDPNHGKWGKRIKHWFCKVGLCNLNSCNCDCHCKKENCCKEKKHEAQAEEVIEEVKDEVVDLRKVTDIEIAYNNIKSGQEYIYTVGIKKVKS